MTNKTPVMLCILDGWALNPTTDNNAVALAHTPHFDQLWNANPHTTLRADGLFVGLPEGQFGNSEVGHTNIGAGRVVMQELPRITQAVKDGSLAKNPVLLSFIDRMKKSGGQAHIMGLVSDGGVHAHQDHIAALVRILATNGVPVAIHIFTDGRDTPPASGHGYVSAFLRGLADLDNTTIATVSGRFYAMDRDNRWERVSLTGIGHFNTVAFGDGFPRQ
jgi:2,3-bisphosphoglycerate-independent phosphoglycerate mutase